jgi:hypothetical protein
MVNNFKTERTKLTSNDVSDMKVRVYATRRSSPARLISQE